MKYEKIITKEYADNMNKNFFKNPKLWYDVILPREKADELREKTKGDYSVIWHEHCEKCWETLDKSTGICYKSEDGFTWLCENCYKILFDK
jgi:hypothetical protein